MGNAKRRLFHAATLTLGVVICTANMAPRPTAPRPRVVLAVDGVGQPRNLPVLVAERLGYFTDAGLTVTLVDAPADPSPATLIADGRADGAVAFYHHTFMTQVEQHIVTEAVVTMGYSPQLKLIVAARLHDRVKQLSDLKGLRVFTGGANSGKTTAMNWLIRRGGLSRADYTAVAPIKPAAMAQALASGEGDAIIAHEPDASSYLHDGKAYVLADLESVAGTQAALGSTYPSTVVYMPKTYVAAHPQIVQHLVDACLRALRYIDTHSGKEIAAILPAKSVKERAALADLLAEDKKAFRTDGIMPDAAAREELSVMADLTPAYRTVVIGETYDNHFVKAAPKH